VDARVGELIREPRKAIGMSQQKLGEAIGRKHTLSTAVAAGQVSMS
jgi:transcriptional regulator with XRE-family HTH domain